MMDLVMSVSFQYFELSKETVLYLYKIVLSLISGCRLYNNAVDIVSDF